MAKVLKVTETKKTTVVTGTTIPASFESIRKRAVCNYSSRIGNKGIDAKRDCITDAIMLKADANYTRDSFLAEFAQHVDLLAGVDYFKSKCADAKFDAFNAATHIAMMNSKKQIVKLIADRDYDSSDSIFKPFKEWAEPIFTKEVLGLENHSYSLPA